MVWHFKTLEQIELFSDGKTNLLIFSCNGMIFASSYDALGNKYTIFLDFILIAQGRVYHQLQIFFYSHSILAHICLAFNLGESFQYEKDRKEK